MLVEKYSQDLAGIKTELSRYSHLSVFNCALNHLHPKDGKDSFGTMPWVIMFLLKLSLQEKSGALHISPQAFHVLANRIFKLGNHLVHVPSKVFLLMVRSMLAQQLWYQVPPIEAWRYVYLQKTLLDRSEDINERLFLSRTGISLQDYYKITVYLLSQAGKQSANSVIRYGLTSFYSHLSPQMSDETLVGFLRLVALPFSHLHSYMQKFVIKDSNSAELYQETPLKNKPIILEGDELVIFNAGICISGLKSIAMDILKGDDSFTDRFGVDVENYIGERLRSTPLDVYSMEDLKGVITVKSRNIADYVVSDGGEVIIFESKSITPNVLIKCTYDPDHLSKLLRDSFIKGITQGQETAHKLAASGRFKGMKARVIIVTLDDFFIYGGDYVADFINEGLEADLVKEYGALPVPMANVLYMTLQDLNFLTEWLKDKPKDSVFKLLDQLAAKQREAGGARFSMAQHISEHIKELDMRGDVGIEVTVERSIADMEGLLGANGKYWRAQHPVTFMRAFDRFQQRLIQSFT
ncbi:hypothetical protein [Azotobacter beijerinckii]|uniref:Uncharacterized protein n=1 Tax=Azotobacter beijerinckii TaxID=170623 RepID=A0A1I4I0L8_9GAMM|nr:hypothetical protein [Azotobacter beijerinckii]SFL47982.1 hypothetical protein SAMN04244574_04437 [Azotobacter beijerinckii]